MAITRALVEELERLQKSQPSLVRLVTKPRAVRLIRGPAKDGPVSGLVVENREGEQRVERGTAMLATGGYAADFDSGTSLLARYTPAMLNFATTNAGHATGGGIKMGEPVGAWLTDMQHVQVHPTGLVDPADPDRRVKFLCAEALRGAGVLWMSSVAAMR
ncbi:flavoprotein subunit-like protein [Trypanosoma conorhini]|uniref:Flavoprotein subunit-like protein n=1 Tax=Trypanosoma conorhini TaxID=83891 RepID=A0A3R7N8J8_9TRYP|nr:flavoprotein subunit-like protein [Trypanosoma conorhini]RNF18079.1 flavoprotein subunit-like protein [Trypanosoma conorhini]